MLDTSSWYPSLVAEASTPKHVPKAKNKPSHKEPFCKMSSSWNLEEVAKQALKQKVEMEARVKYLQYELTQLMRER